jgi:hypothetical protein
MFCSLVGGHAIAIAAMVVAIAVACEQFVGRFSLFL